MKNDSELEHGHAVMHSERETIAFGAARRLEDIGYGAVKNDAEDIAANIAEGNLEQVPCSFGFDVEHTWGGYRTLAAPAGVAANDGTERFDEKESHYAPLRPTASYPRLKTNFSRSGPHLLRPCLLSKKGDLAKSD